MRLIWSILFLIVFSVKVSAQEVTEDPEQVRPLQKITREQLLEAAQFGIGVAVALNPATEGAKTVLDLTKIGLEESIKAAEFRTQAVESHLMVITQEADKLEQLKKRDGHLKSPDAQKILKDISEGHFSQGDEWKFLFRSVASSRFAYGVASHYYIDKWFKEFFGSIGKNWQLGNRVEYMWVGKKSYVRTYTNISWGLLKVLGAASRDFTYALQKVFLKTIGKKFGNYVVRSELDKYAEEVLKEHPSIPSAAVVVRLDAAIHPLQVLPIVVAAQPIAPAPPVAVAVPVVIPVVATPILVQSDPVVSAASVNRQVLEPFSVSSGKSETVHSEPEVEHPSRVHSYTPPIGGTWGGERGGSLWSR